MQLVTTQVNRALFMHVSFMFHTTHGYTCFLVFPHLNTISTSTKFVIDTPNVMKSAREVSKSLC